MKTRTLYDDYKISFKEDYTTNDESYYLIFNENRELYLKEYKPLKFEKEIKFNILFQLYIGEYKNKPCFAIYTDTNITHDFYPLPEVYSLDESLYLVSCRAILVIDWYKNHKYCGACGTRTILDDKDMMLKCPKCGQVHYTRIAPAIIVAIKKDDKLLMAKHKRHNGTYSLIAGFVEAGESVEDAVHREVLEEVGLHIKNLEYVKSQSWPYPNSLMLAFTADYDYGSIKVDMDEIIDAGWFGKNEIEVPDSNISVFSYLVNDFIKKRVD